MGQLILAVDGHRVEGLQHQDVARLIAESFAQRDKQVRSCDSTCYCTVKVLQVCWKKSLKEKSSPFYISALQ